MNRIDDKVVLITGGARGQGRAEAELCVSAGAQVVITDIDQDLGNAVADEIGQSCVFLSQDVASEEQWQMVVEEVVERFGKIDALINNAGIFRVQELEETSAEDSTPLLTLGTTY